MGTRAALPLLPTGLVLRPGLSAAPGPGLCPTARQCQRCSVLSLPWGNPRPTGQQGIAQLAACTHTLRNGAGCANCLLRDQQRVLCLVLTQPHLQPTVGTGLPGQGCGNEIHTVLLPKRLWGSGYRT